MCGIAGFINVLRKSNDAEQLIDRMCKVIRHRGPDDQGVWVGDGVALGMRRLAIIDLAGGHQPIFNEDQSILVVFNGEIYNYRELQKELVERGHHFRTKSDTETIVHAYEEYGDDCVKHLRGMFTFAIWDRKRQRLLAARDRFGKKPLNYYWDGQRLIFGSEIKSILPAAHILIYEAGQINTKCYWELSFTPTCQDDEATAIERTRALLKEAVQIRLMSEVPLGAFLSGGVDSSIVVGLMSSMMSQPVKTFSIGFAEEDFSELPYARQVARYFGTEHQEFFVRPELISILPQLVWAYDEPFGDASMLPTYYVSKLAREHVTVVLTGDGGDEIFGGYTRYEHLFNINRIPAFVRFLARWGSMLIPDKMRGKRRLRNMGCDLPTSYIEASGLFPIGWRSSIYTQEHFAHMHDHNPYERQLSEFAVASHLDIAAQMQYVDVRTYLPDDILVKVDKASMFNSLETRTPLLDQYLVEYVSSLPSALRLRNGVLKYLLKKIAADMLPAEVLMRGKQGFGVPIKHWFRSDLADYAHDLLDSPRARQRGIFNPRFVRNLLKEHRSTNLVNHSAAIWALLCLELWFRTYMDEPSTVVEQYMQTQIMGN